MSVPLEASQPLPKLRLRWLGLGVWASFYLLMIWAKLYWLDKPLPQLADWIMTRRPRRAFHNPSPNEWIDLRVISGINRRLLQHLAHTSRPCMAKSFCLLLWCRKAAINADLLIGVRKGQSALSGHAWLEVDGAPVAESPSELDSYTVMLRFSSERGQAGKPSAVL